MPKKIRTRNMEKENYKTGTMNKETKKENRTYYGHELDKDFNSFLKKKQRRINT